MSTSARRLHLLALVSYALLALLLTYPVVLAPGRWVPGSDTWAYDEYTYLWNIWWLRRSALDLGINPLYTGYTFYPVGAPLVLYTYALLNCALALPVYLLGSLPLASNLVLWATMALSGYAAYLLSRYVIRRRMRLPDGPAAHLAASLGGLAYAFAASRFVYLAIGHYSVVAVAMLPLFAIFLMRVFERRRWLGYAALAGVLLTLSALAEMTFLLFLGLLMLIFSLFALRRLGIGPVMARTSVVAASCAATYAPVLYYIVRESVAGGYGLQGWGDSLRLGADLVGLVTPTALNTLWGRDWAAELARVAAGAGRFSDVNTFYAGYVTLMLALLGGITCRRRLAQWLVTASAAIVLSLGPLLHVNGRSLFDFDGLRTSVPLPFVLLHYIPIANAGRTPNRFSVLALLAMAPLVAVGAYRLLCLTRRWWLTAVVAFVLAGLLLVDGISVPIPVTDASLPDFYVRLGTEHSDYAIMTLPFGLRSSFGTRGAEQTQLQYYQTAHGKRVIGGNASRLPSIAFQYFERIGPLAAIMAAESYQPADSADLPRLRGEAAELAALLDLRYLVVHSPVPGRLPYADTYRDAIALALTLFNTTEVYRDPGGRLVAYGIESAPVPPRQDLDLGSGGGAMHLGDGWSEEETVAGATARWVEGRRGVVYFAVSEVADYLLTIRANPFTYPGASPQSLEVLVNGQGVAFQAVTPGWQQYRIELPASALRTSANAIEFRFAYARRPMDVLPDTYAIGSTGVTAPVRLEAHSSRDLAYITVAESDGSSHVDGLNLAVFDASTGALLAHDAFTWNAGQELAAFLGKATAGSGVIVAAKGGVPAGLAASICEALSEVGAIGCPNGVDGYALIGVKGAAPGTALEVAGVDAYLALSPDRRELSAAVDWVRLERLP